MVRAEFFKVDETGSVDGLKPEEKALFSRAAEDADCAEYCDITREPGFMLPRKGHKKDVVSVIVYNEVVKKRRGQYNALGKFIFPRHLCVYPTRDSDLQ